MAVSLVNKTIYTNASLPNSGTFNLSTPSTAGNWLLLASGAEGGQDGSFTTDQGEVLVKNPSGVAVGNIEIIWWILQTTKPCTSITFASVGGNLELFFAGVYELSGNNIAFTVVRGTSNDSGSVTHLVGPSLAGPATGTSFYASGPGWGSFTNGTVCTVSSGWTLDKFTPTGSFGGGNAYLLGNGTQQATFTLSIAQNSLTAVGVFFYESAPIITPTTTAIVSNVNPSTLGQLVTFTATVSGPGGVGSPTGTVTFNIDGSNVTTVAVSADGAGMAIAQYATAILGLGTHPVYAVYSGDTNYDPSTSPTINQVVEVPAPTPPPTSKNDFGNSTADVIWWHTGFTGIDEEIAAMEGMISEGGPPNIPWLLGLATSQGNAVTEALAKSNILYCEPEYGNDGGGGGNETGASQTGGGGTSGGLLVDW